VVHRAAIIKQGSGLVRWAAAEAVGNYRAKANERLLADYNGSASAGSRARPASRWPASTTLTRVLAGQADPRPRCLTYPVISDAVDRSRATRVVRCVGRSRAVDLIVRLVSC